MLESVLARLLNQSLGWIVEDLDAHDLKLGVFSGDLVLKDLQLKPDGLAALGVPLKMCYGKISLLRLKVPWTNLRTGSVVVEIDKVYAVFRPLSAEEANLHRQQAHSAEALRKRQQQELQVYEAAMAKLAEGERNESYQEAFVSSIFAKVMNNLQVVINNIHIRLEQITPASFASSSTPRSYVCGISLQRFSIKSPAEPVEISGMKESGEGELPTEKQAEVTGFRVYWDSDNAARSALVCHDTDGEVDVLEEVMGDAAPGAEAILEDYDISVALSVYLKGKPRDASEPSAFVRCNVPRLCLRVRKHQVNGVVTLGNYFGRLAAPPVEIGLRSGRPLEQPLEDPRAWWRFAIRCVIDDMRSRLKSEVWAQIVEQRRKQVEYIQVYKQTLTYSWGRGLVQRSRVDSAVRKMLLSLEANLDTNTITAYRSQARKLVRERHNRNGGPRSWFSGIGSMFRSSSNAVELSSEEKEELLHVLDLDEASQGQEQYAVALTQAGTKMQMEFGLQYAALELQTGLDTGSVRLEVEDIAFLAVSAGEARDMNASMRSIQLLDSRAEKSVITTELNGAASLLSIAGSMKGLYSSVKLDMQTISVKITSSFLKRVLTGLKDQHGERLDATLAGRAEQLQQAGNERLGSALSRAREVKQLRMEMSVAPQILQVEENIVLSTGRLNVDTESTNSFQIGIRGANVSVIDGYLIQPIFLVSTVNISDNGVKSVELEAQECFTVNADQRKLKALLSSIEAIQSALPDSPSNSAPPLLPSDTVQRGADTLVATVNFSLPKARVNVRNNKHELITSLLVSGVKVTQEENRRHTSQVATIDTIDVEDGLRSGSALLDLRQVKAVTSVSTEGNVEERIALELSSLKLELYVPTLNRLIGKHLVVHFNRAESIHVCRVGILCSTFSAANFSSTSAGSTGCCRLMQKPATRRVQHHSRGLKGATYYQQSARRVS